MGNTQQQGKYFIKAVNAFNSNSKRRFRRVQFSDEDDELDGEEDVPFVNEFDAREKIPVRLRFPFGYSSDYQSFCVVITNQPQVFWLPSSSVPVVDGGTLSQPRVLLLSQVNSASREDTLLVLRTSLHFEVEILTSSSLEARRWIAAIVSQKKHPHGAIVFLSCDVKISKEAVALMSNYSRPSFMGHNNFGSRRAREIQQPPPEAGFGSMFGYAECRNAGKSSTNEDMAIHHSGALPYSRTWWLSLSM